MSIGSTCMVPRHAAIMPRNAQIGAPALQAPAVMLCSVWARLYRPGSTMSEGGSRSPMRPSRFVTPAATPAQACPLPGQRLAKLTATPAAGLPTLVSSTCVVMGERC